MSAGAEEYHGPPSCSYCGVENPSLVSVDAGMKLRLQQTGALADVPSSVCEGCHQQLSRLISKGAVLRQEAKAKEQNKLAMWKGRVSLVKKAKAMLAQKNFSEAALSYEKYIRVLEICFEVKAGELRPDLFKQEAKKQELTVITSVYWDLMRIYDTSARYGDRQEKAADKLAAFAKYSTIYPLIVRKAERDARNARNPQIYKKFLKAAGSSRGPCFVATAAFENELHPDVEALRLWRERDLRQHSLGRVFIYFYELVGPFFAVLLNSCPRAKPYVRKILTWLVRQIDVG